MEIKRFVLLNDYNLILDSKNEEELRVIHYKDGDVLKVVVDNWYYPLEKLDYKTSDNILDLIEVGDLIEKDNDWEILKVMRFNIDGNMVCLIHTSSNIEEYEINEYRKKFITAIYKHQSNGDYKRYEIGGKE